MDGNLREFFDRENLVLEHFAGMPQKQLDAIDVDATRRWLVANAQTAREVVQSNALDVALCGAVGALLRKFERDEEDVHIRWFERREMLGHLQDISGVPVWCMSLKEYEARSFFAWACCPFFGPGDYWRPYQSQTRFLPEDASCMIRIERLETVMLVANLETLLRLSLAVIREEWRGGGDHREIEKLGFAICSKLASMARPRDSQIRRVGYLF